MITVRKAIHIRDGVEVALLFTPHLYSFKDSEGLTLECEGNDVTKVLELYADLFFLSAINAFILDDKGAREDFPYTRGDFHEWMMTSPKEFGDTVKFAVEALSGKKIEKQIENQEDSKKKRLRSSGLLLRLFSWAGAGRHSGKQP